MICYLFFPKNNKVIPTFLFSYFSVFILFYLFSENKKKQKTKRKKKKKRKNKFENKQMQEVHVEVGKRVERHPSGHFREVYANGTVYEGNLVNLIREGYGFLTEWDTSEYIGEWKQDMRSGLGVSTINPCKYEGLFEVDSPNGKGRLIAPQYTYAGDFVYGKPHGFGYLFIILFYLILFYLLF